MSGSLYRVKVGRVAEFRHNKLPPFWWGGGVEEITLDMHSECIGRSLRGTNGDERRPASCKMDSFQSLRLMEQIYRKSRRHIQFFQEGDDVLKLHLNTARLLSFARFLMVQV